MFKENKDYHQNQLFNSLSGMDTRLKDKLEKSWAGPFFHHVFCQIDEKLFAPLYSSDNGRPNFPVNIFVGLDIIKNLRDYTDEVLFEEYAYNYQISYALGLQTLGQLYFAPRTFYDFRARLYHYTINHPQEADIIFGQFEKLTNHFIKAAKLNTDEQRMDSTLIMANIKRAGRLALAYDVLIKGIKASPAELLSASLKEVLEAGYKNKILYKLKNTEVPSRLEMLLNLCAELLKLVKDNEKLSTEPDIKLVERFLTEQANFDKERKVWVPKDDKDILASSLQSAHDTDATFRKKAGKGHTGYVANIAETCSEENPVQVVTDFQVEPNITSDIEMAEKALPDLVNKTGLKELYTDGGYYGEDVVNKAQELGVEVHYTDMTGKKPSGTRLPYNAFRIKENKKIELCPENHAPLRFGFNPKNGLLNAHFNREICEQCPQKELCPVKFQKKDTVLYVSQKALIAEDTRHKMQQPDELKTNTSKRAAIEGTNSALKRSRGAGKLNVRGLAKCQLVMGLKLIAHNFHQIVRYFQGAIRKSKKISRTLQGIPVAIYQVITGNKGSEPPRSLGEMPEMPR